MNRLFRLRKFVEYQVRAKTKYYLHSPFIYQFYLNVLEGEPDENILLVRKLRQELRASSASVKIIDYGTGTSCSRKISDLERNVAVREKYGTLLYRLVKNFAPRSILELGTSMGISSAYMALASPDSQIVSLEGSPYFVPVARQNHEFLGIKNVEFIIGDFSDALESSFQKVKNADLIFFDGNHRKDSTLKYFHSCLEHASENSIFVFDDIYHSREMSEGWEEIQLHPSVTLTVDIFQFGICFFRKEKLAKENFVLRY
jgi:predicted O-methyltransferase YrrM